MKKIVILLASLMMTTLLAAQNNTQQSKQDILNNLKSAFGAAASQVGTAASEAAKSTASQAVQSLTTTATEAAQSAQTSDVVSKLSSFVKSLSGTTLSATNIAGTWKYSEPAVQFESENLLAKAGGAVVAESVETKLNNFFTKAGIKQGVLKFTFAEDGTFTSTLGSRSFNGRYTLDATSGTIKLTYLTALNTELLNINADVKLLSTGMSLLFDADKLLKWFTVVAKASNKTNVKSIAALAGNYNGMKVGFEFSK